VRPVVARAYRLDEIARAQAYFLKKDHVGKLVLVPPPV
jgi:NADPH:quinone reductase-like Zn-dependent oxidoreductase